MAERDHGLKRLHRLDEGARIRQFVLGLVSMGTGVPITLFASGMTVGENNVAGIAVAWLGIVGVNVSHAWSLRRPS
ncbi:MAG: hypothetical protein ACRDO1_01255 [Nocardioidaceae bacterium]